MDDTTAPAKNLGLGDKIEHDLMPGFVMEIQAVEPCETDGNRSEEHAKFRITDPGGDQDWLCAYDVHRAG